MQRIIREQEPIKPSTKLSTLGETLTDIAKHRGCTPDLLRKVVRGDLDWIVMKSLEKDRARRYDTASAVATDIQHHLDHEPVLVRGPSAAYRLQKFSRRHRNLLVAVLGLLILVALLVSTLSTRHENRMRVAEAESFRLSEARNAYTRADLATTLKTVEPILHSRQVGSEARLLYAGILVDAHRYDEAAAELEKLVNERPEIAGAAHSLWTRVLWESEQLDTETLDKIEEHRQKAEELLPETAEAYFLRAMTALTISERFEFLDQALKADPSHYGACRLRALTYYASRRYEKMREDARVMVVLRPRDSLGYSLRATALTKLGRYEEAIADYDRAISCPSIEDPQRVELYAQRCETLIRTSNYEEAIAYGNRCLMEFPDETVLHFHVSCALTALGRYEDASALFERVAKPDPALRSRFRDWAMKYVFDTLEAGRSWHPPDSDPRGIASLAMIEAEKIYNHLSAHGAMRLISDGFAADWSPDGRKLAFSLGVRGTSGLATFDLTSREMDLLIVPGRDPKWSPDGRHIAFVRDRPALSLSKLTKAERRYRYSWTEWVEEVEVWVVREDGTEPRRLASGGGPFWSQDSKHVNYSFKGILRSKSIEDSETPAQEILKVTGSELNVSPDGNYVANSRNGSLEIRERISRAVVAQCEVPPRLSRGSWAPNGRQLTLLDLNDPETTTGLWIYDLDVMQIRKVLAGPIAGASWSPGETALAFSLGPPFCEIWIANLDPSVSTIDALGPGRTKEEYYQDNVGHYTQAITADPEDAKSYLRRARYHHYLDNQEDYIADMNKYVGLLYPRGGASSPGLRIRDLLNRLWRSTPSNLGANVNSPRVDGTGSTGCLSADGRSLYLESSRSGGHDIWITTRETTADPWSPPVNLGSPVNTEFVDGVPSLTADGLSLFFHSDRTGGYGEFDIWMSRRERTDDPWGQPVNLGPPVNSADYEWSHCISPNGLTLYFGSNRPGTYGNSDIWVTRRTSADDDWSVPENLGPVVNGLGDDYVPTLSPDGLMLFYTCVRPGGYGGWDIWVTGRETTNGPWGEPVNLGVPINTSRWEELAIISPDDSTFYFSSTRPDGCGGEDIWYVPILPPPGDLEDGNKSGSGMRVDRGPGSKGGGASE